MYVSFVIAAINLALVYKFWTLTSNMVVPKGRVDKFRAMGWLTALLFLTPAILSSLEVLGRSPNEGADETVHSLGLLVVLIHVYVFWRVLFVCTDQDSVFDTLRVLEGEPVDPSFPSPETYCSSYITKLIFCLSYEPLEMLSLLIWEWLSPRSLEEAFLSLAKVDICLRAFIAIFTLYYSWQMVGIMALLTRLPRPREKLLLVLWMHPLVSLFRDALTLSELVFDISVRSESDADAGMFVGDQISEMVVSGNAATEIVVQVQLLVISLLYWRLWTTKDISVVFETDLGESSQVATLLSGADSTDWLTVEEGATQSKITGLTSHNAIFGYNQSTNPNHQVLLRDAPVEEFAYANLLGDDQGILNSPGKDFAGTNLGDPLDLLNDAPVEEYAYANLLETT